jgi:hypothetical protein
MALQSLRNPYPASPQSPGPLPCAVLPYSLVKALVVPTVPCNCALNDASSRILPAGSMGKPRSVEIPS